MECHGCGDGFMIFMEGDLMDLMCGFRDLYILGSFKLIFAEAQGVFFCTPFTTVDHHGI